MGRPRLTVHDEYRLGPLQNQDLGYRNNCTMNLVVFSADDQLVAAGGNGHLVVWVRETREVIQRFDIGRAVT